MHVQPYLSFEGRCEEALNFYRQALGAEINMMMRFRDAPDQSMVTAGSEDKIMHASFIVGGTSLMASHGRCGGKSVFQGINLSLEADDDASAEAMFTALGQGGQVQMPMATTFFASRFGIVADKFGVSWMVMCQPK